MQKNKLVFVISIILISIILFTLNIRGTAFNQKYYPSQTEENLINYLQHPTASPELISEFSANEQSHLKDVQNIFLLNTIVLAIALILFTTLLPKIKIYKTLIFGGILTIILTIILVLLILNFDKTFTAFHHIFFTGNWQFPQASLLLTLFPKQFFMQMTKRIIINTILSAIIITGAGIIYFFKESQP